MPEGKGIDNPAYNFSQSDVNHVDTSGNNNVSEQNKFKSN